MNIRPGNRLSTEQSPYLLQHAHNPVDWYPWGEEAFLRAQAEDKPIFLSIGYSTCHWCHVMERESFEDNGIARMLNDVFVCVKVDREERPDIDGVYMTVCQMMTGSGGWPLTIFLLPDKRPFFAATYIPKHAAYGRLGMFDLIPQIGTLWRTRRQDIEEAARQTIDGVKGILSGIQAPATKPLDAATLHKAYGEFETRFDPAHGGFGTAPKFPTPHNLVFLLRYWHRTGQQRAITMAEKTLEAMRMGGIYDHIGLGFHRYSTDPSWLVPHFEKMLYDQALTAMAYTEAYQATKKTDYERTVREIFAYVLRDMSSPQGPFFSAEDADSEGIEGKFYLWEESEIRSLLTDEEARPFIETFGVREKGNAPGLEHGDGKNILHLSRPIGQVAHELGISVDALEEVLESGRCKLLRARDQRIRPLKDDKILTDWNGLMCAALARGGDILGEKRYIEAARRSVDFILSNLRTSDGRLLHRFRDGHVGITGNVDDYAFLVWALIELYEATFEIGYLETAIHLTDIQIAHFWDHQGGFFFAADDGESLPVRRKEVYDGAIPSGNSVTLLNLLRLSRMTGREDYEEKAGRTIDVFAENVMEFPMGYTHFLQGLDFWIGPSVEVVLSGREKADDRMLDALRKAYAPNKVVLFVSEINRDKLMVLAPFIASYGLKDEKPAVYVCRGQECELPTTDVDRMISYLSR